MVSSLPTAPVCPGYGGSSFTGEAWLLPSRRTVVQPFSKLEAALAGVRLVSVPVHPVIEGAGDGSAEPARRHVWQHVVVGTLGALGLLRPAQALRAA